MTIRMLARPTFTLLAVIAAATVLIPTTARAIDTSRIVSSAASTDCIDFKAIGVCVWMTCTPFGCDFETSVRYQNYMPDLVVSTYHRTGDNPWAAVASWAPPTSQSRAGGIGTQDRTARIHTDLHFNNADAIGHPALTVMNNIDSLCHSAATAFEPYYLSVYDALAWRQGIPEKVYPEALMPGARTIGTFGNVWGHVYPRSGFVIQANPYKAAAVAAQRVADFVTRDGQPHVYIPLTANAEPGWWPPGPVVEGEPDTHKWQRLQPNLTQACHVFPDHGTLASFAGDIASAGDYVWTLWRPYKCCDREGAVLIAYTGG